MYCRGHNRRIEIVKDYDITPFAHFPVMGSEEVRSDAGDDITDSYFLFNCIHKESKSEELICCGISVARDFCDLLGVDLPRLFNPLVEAGHGGSGGSVGKSGVRWDPTRKQLYNATMLFIIWLNKKHNVLYSIKEELEQNTDKAPTLSKIKSVNTLYKKYKTTARGVVEELSKKNHIRDFRFDRVVQVLQDEKIEQYFEK